MNLLEAMKMEQNWTRTENGALTLKSTLDDILDLFYHAPAKRGQNNTELFANAYGQDRLLALKTIFYVRDIRGGAGERETFLQALRWLYKNDLPVFEAVVDLVPIYGRWKDIIEFATNGKVIDLVLDQLKKDSILENPSLLAKWMPSENASSDKTVALAQKWIRALGLTPSSYRHLLVNIRRNLKLVETAISNKDYASINYEHVPSRAGALLRKAFSRNDAKRYVAYLESVKKGEKKINAATLYPYELVQGYAAKYMEGYTHITPLTKVDDTIEALWKALPNYAEDNTNVLGMVDISESMYQSRGGRIVPIYVSVSLGIYLAERNHGIFKDNFMTFNNTPKLVTLRNGTLKSKVDQVFRSGIGYNTNIQAAFNMLLDVAIKNAVSPEDMPTRVIIFSDMEFDNSSVNGNRTNFAEIKRSYARAGYEMPTLVFWNIDSREIQTPVTKDQKGVYLVSGCSPSIMKNVLNSKAINPLELMFEKLNEDRYAAIEEALK